MSFKDSKLQKYWIPKTLILPWSHLNAIKYIIHKLVKDEPISNNNDANFIDEWSM